MHQEISIVLTATIVPNSILVEHDDIEQRRIEYLTAIQYYQPYANIYFLENSSYDIFSDKEFFQYKNVNIRKFPVSKYYDKGKGYQEFEMLDNWFRTEENLPSHWIKITGRYIVHNFNKVIDDCKSCGTHSVIIEQSIQPSKIAHTDLFYVNSTYYRNCFLGAYMGCDDLSNRFIEHVIREQVQIFGEFRVFKAMPIINGTSGSTGKKYNITVKKKIKYALYNLIFILFRKYRVSGR